MYWFNNAGIHEKVNVLIHECTEEDFDRVIAVNLKGVFLCMKYAISGMIKAGGGSIISQGSSTCVLGIPKHPAYSASRGYGYTNTPSSWGLSKAEYLR